MEIIDKLYKLKENMPDLQIKVVSFKLNKLYIINIQTVSSSKLTNEYIMQYLSRRSLLKKDIISSIKSDISNYIPSVSYINILEKEVLEYLFNGFSIIIFKNEILAFETKALLDRGVTEPTSEPTIKGPKDAFNENYNTNIGLIRKRIKDENLFITELNLGSKTKTKIALFYMNNIVDKDLLNNVIEKLNSIQTDKILDTYYIKDLIKHENNTAFPTIKSTEKPDIVSKSILEGKICIISENSNNVLIIPTFFLDYFYYGEDNYQKPIFTIFAKVIRVSALLLTLFAPAMYLALVTYDQQALPTNLLISFASQRQSVPFPALIEALILMFTFELLYEGDALTPISRGTSLSILGALVLGESAVNAGVVSPIMVIVVALTAISSLFFVYYDFQSFIRLYRYGLMVLSSFFGILGVYLGFMIFITKLCSLKSFGKPFLLPISPILNKRNRKYLIKNALLVQNTNKGEQ